MNLNNGKQQNLDNFYFISHNLSRYLSFLSLHVIIILQNFLNLLIMHFNYYIILSNQNF